MKKLLFILLCLPMIGFGQLTMIPDDNFENYLETNGMGNGIANDNYVFTSAIDTVTSLNISTQGLGAASSIHDLTGIQDFTTLNYLDCSYNWLTSIDVNQNTALTYLDCNANGITNLNVSQNTALIYLHCGNNQLTLGSLDVSQNTALTTLICYNSQLTSLNVSGATSLDYLACQWNQLTSLDVTNNLILNELDCSYNQITSLELSYNQNLRHARCHDNQLTYFNFRNGFNYLMCVLPATSYYAFNVTNNSALYCVGVDDSIWATNNWTVVKGNIDPQQYFSENCSLPSAIQEYTTNKELLKVTDLLGRETKGKKNQPLFYIYNDGTVEKRIVIE